MESGKHRRAESGERRAGGETGGRCFGALKFRSLGVECFIVFIFYPVWRDKPCHRGDKACHARRKFDVPTSSEKQKAEIRDQKSESHAESAETRRKAGYGGERSD